MSKLKTQPAQQKVPSIIQMLGHCPECGAKAHHFTSPPASKPWVGLTDEEWQEIDASLNGKRDLARIFVKALEAKLREKNT